MVQSVSNTETVAAGAIRSGGSQDGRAVGHFHHNGQSGSHTTGLILSKCQYRDPVVSIAGNLRGKPITTDGGFWGRFNQICPATITEYFKR